MTKELTNELDLYEKKSCSAFSSCSDCPANITDDYGSHNCGFDLVNEAIKYIDEKAK